MDNIPTKETETRMKLPDSLETPPRRLELFRKLGIVIGPF
jgi:hypothetical protein